MRSPASVAAVLLITVLCIALPGAALAVTDGEARDAAALRVAEVGAYSRDNPEEPGAMAAWSALDAVVGRPVLIHAYPSLEPSYYYVPVLDPRGVRNSFVTLGADDGRIHAYGEIGDDGRHPLVEREAAADIVASITRRTCDADELIAVSMPDRNIYWCLRRPSGRQLFVNLCDPDDVHTGLDASLTPPDVIAEPAPAIVEIPVRPQAAGGRYPTSYNLSVPHHYQGTSYHCGPASVEMVLDYWGPDIDQTDIGHVANCTSSAGSYASDNRRAGHFSCLSNAILDPSLYGYTERWLGYGACECQWSYPGTGDPDYSTRYTDLYELIYAGYPVEVLTYYDATHGSGHFRVVKGYNNSTDVFIVHDPWYTGTYQGPNVNFDQSLFVDDLWTRYYRWGTLMSPWKVQVTAPSAVVPGDEFTLSIEVTYRGPHPFEGQYAASSVNANPDLPAGFELAPGETVDKSLPGLGSSGSTGSASWQVIASCEPGIETIGAIATGQIFGSSYSYSSYGDVIGGEGSTTMEVLAASRMIYVDVGGGGDFLTIQEGIDDARCDGDMVYVQPGTYVGASNKNLDFGGKNITLLGSGVENTAIDCQDSGRALYFHSGEDTTAVVSGLTIVGGHPAGTFPYGGGIEIEDASPKLTDLVVIDCWAYCGGGISWADASPVLVDVAVLNNQASDYGGGIFCTRDSLGGRLQDVDVSDNIAGYGGGGIYDTYNMHSLYDVTLRNNSAQWGGGMYIARDASEIKRAQIQGNSATLGSGLYIAYESETDITRSTVVHNTTTDSGSGAIDSNDSEPQISRSITAYNWTGSGMTCSGPKLPTIWNSLSYANDAGDSLCGTHYDNLFTNPYFCDQPNEDFTLHSDSPCLPAYNPWGVQIGRYGAGGCGYADLDDGLAPSHLSLGSPAPNPFGRTASIPYETPRSSSPLTVAVYNLSGRLVKVLYEGTPAEPAGTLKWDGTDETGARVAAGVYFVRASLDSEIASRKLVVLR